MSGRIRTIKPEMLEDAVTAGLSDTAFRLLIGLILLADDFGRMRAEPAYLAGQVHWKRPPTSPLEDALAELEPLVRFYDVKGQRYGAIRNWEKHQKISHRGKPRIPEPPTAEQSSGDHPEASTSESEHPPETLRRNSGDPPESLAKSSALITDQGSPTSDQRPATEDQRPRTSAGEPPAEPARPATPARGRRKTLETSAPDELRVTSDLEDWCVREGLSDPHEQVKAFLLKARSKGWKYADWDQALRNWIWGEGHPKYPNQQPAPPWDTGAAYWAARKRVGLPTVTNHTPEPANVVPMTEAQQRDFDASLDKLARHLGATG